MESLDIEMNEGYALIKEHKQEEITKSGIYIPPKKWYRYYDVIVSNIDGIYKGDVVLIELGKGTNHIINDKQYLVYHKDNIMAKMID